MRKLSKSRGGKAVQKSKIGRNALCTCGSGRKYKKCCINRTRVIKGLDKQGIRFKTPKEIQGIRRTGELVIETLDFIEAKISPGITTDSINRLVHCFTIEQGAIPAPLNYRGYPKSVCVSVNEVICHGIPGERILVDGDIINIDVTSILNGYYADASKTFFVGEPNDDARLIVDVARECLSIGIGMVKPGNTTADIGQAIQNYAENQGCSVVREFVGHGIGLEFHEPPHIPHYNQPGEIVPLFPNMTFTIEPMINLGKKELEILTDGWTVITCDGSLSAQFEQTLCVTESGCESLTPYEL